MCLCIGAFGPLVELSGQAFPAFEPSGGQRVQEQPRFSSREERQDYDWDALCAQRGYDIIFLYQRHFPVPAGRMLKQSEGGWRNVLKDEEVSFNWKWKGYYQDLPVESLLLAVDEIGSVFTPAKVGYSLSEGGWDEVGRLHRKSWVKRRMVPVLKGASDGAWHAFFMLFGH